MKELIRKILKEETSPNEKETIQDLIKDFGYETAIKYLGGLDNFISADGMNLYLHTTLVDQLGLENVNSSASTFSRPKTLGKFRYGSKNDIPYAFTANLEPTRLHNIYYKVVGSSGDSGFGYNFITKRNTLSKRYRQQIFKQIIDKYDLEPYMKVKTFY